MDQQIKRFLELSKILYNKGMYEEVWKYLSQAYLLSGRNESIKETLLQYFYYPNKNIYENNYKTNLLILRNNKKIYDYKDEIENIKCNIQIIWNNMDSLFYFKENELKEHKLLNCPENEERSVLYENIMLNHLPQSNKFSLLLYYDEEIFKCIMQIFSLSEMVERSKLIFVGKGLEKYIAQNGDTAIDAIIGYNSSNIWARLMYAEKHRSLGKLYDKYTFFIIRIRDISSSLGPLMLWVLSELKRIDKKGYIPVIDFSCYYNPLLEDDEIGIINPWEYYFEQPTHFSLQSAYHAKNVIIGNANADENLSQIYEDLVDFPEVLKEYSKIFSKYIYINKRIEKKCISIYKDMIKSNWRILGVVYRGTDYRNRPVVNEHRQPSLEELMEKAEQLMNEWNCDHIFLATEDKEAVEKFKQKFGERVVYTKKKRYESSVKYTRLHKFNREFDSYLKGKEYLIEIYILSKCNCLLSSRVGILGIVLPMNNGKYEKKYIYDLGKYTIEDYLKQE